jgi:hypothetical protein
MVRSPESRWVLWYSVWVTCLVFFGTGYTIGRMPYRSGGPPTGLLLVGQLAASILLCGFVVRLLVNQIRALTQPPRR